MSETLIIAEFNDYDGLQRALRQRAESLQISRETLTTITGMQDGQVNKILADPPSKNMGILSFGEIVQGLACKLLLVEDAELRRTLASRMVKRVEQQVRVKAMPLKPQKQWLFSRRKARELRQMQLAQFTPEQQSRIARKAARNRWKRWRKEKREQKKAEA